MGYRGVIGIDFIVKNMQTTMVEINTRFQASSILLNIHLNAFGQETLIERHLCAFNKNYSRINHETTNCNLSIYNTYRSPIENGVHFNCNPEIRQSIHHSEKYKYTVVDANSKLENYGHLTSTARIIFQEEISSIMKDGELRINPAILSDSFCFEREELLDVVKLKFSLLAYGCSITQKALQALYNERKYLTMRDGIAGGLDIQLNGLVFVNVPVKEKWVIFSPFTIDYDGEFYLLHDSKYLQKIVIVKQADFVGRLSSSGKPFETIGQIFTDRLGLYPFCGCNYGIHNAGCGFCEIGQVKVQTPIDIGDALELIEHCINDKKINCRHILISGGSPQPKFVDAIVTMAQAIKKLYDIPLYVMMEPPSKADILKKLKRAGVDEIGFNLEVYDRQLAKQLMPGKGFIDLDRYTHAFMWAKKLWSQTGAVRSILIAGLEPWATTLLGVKYLCELGVMPILSPFRPIQNTPLKHVQPLSPEKMYEIWQLTKEISDKYSMPLGPLCLCCQNNTITAPDAGHYFY